MQRLLPSHPLLEEKPGAEFLLQAGEKWRGRGGFGVAALARILVLGRRASGAHGAGRAWWKAGLVGAG